MSRTNKEKTMFRGIDRSIFGSRMRPAVLQTGRACSFLSAAVVLAGFLTAPAHGQVSVLTQNYDNGRSGSNNHETTLTPALLTASPTTFGKLFTITLDNNVYGMPLVLGGVNISGRPTNILIVRAAPPGASGSRPPSLEAFDADTEPQLWSFILAPIPRPTTPHPLTHPPHCP